VRLSDAEVSVLDGPNAGRRVTTSADGEYRMTGLQPANANVAAAASGYLEQRAGVVIAGASTLNFELPEASPLVTFGPGEHRVGGDLPAGRYFADPGTGCYWERRSGDGGGQVVAFGFIEFDAAQWIVDVNADDRIFQSSEACGTWSNRARGGVRSETAAGVWVIGAQVAPGTYSSSARAGCYWERLADFGGRPEAVIAADLVATDGPAFVTLLASDAGFRSHAACGTWTRAPSGSLAASVR
jgi:hypothetical protein